MTNSTPSPEAQINAEAQRIAKAALGIPETGQLLKPIDMNKIPLAAFFHEDGGADIHSHVPRATAVMALRRLADKLEAGE